MLQSRLKTREAQPHNPRILPRTAPSAPTVLEHIIAATSSTEDAFPPED